MTDDTLPVDLTLDDIIFINALMGLAKESLQNPDAKSYSDCMVAAYMYLNMFPQFITNLGIFMANNIDDASTRAKEILTMAMKQQEEQFHEN